jgi:hypothetical protein
LVQSRFGNLREQILFKFSNNGAYTKVVGHVRIYKLLLRLTDKGSVADPGFLYRIPDPDFYPSRIPDPDFYLSRIQQQQKKIGKKKLVLNFEARNFRKLKIFHF